MWDRVPYDIFLKIVSYILDSDLNTCRLICTKWHTMVDNGFTWLKIYRQTWGTRRIPKNWKHYYILCKKRKNLVTNPSARQNFTGWITRNTGHSKWETKNINIVCTDHHLSTCFMSSFGNGILFQTIDLIKKGYTEYTLDNISFDINVSFCYMPEQAHCRYMYYIELISKDMETIGRYSEVFQFWKYVNTYTWEHISYTFSKPQGVRYVNIIHEVENHYNNQGINITGHDVKIIYPEDEFAGDQISVLDFLYRDTVDFNKVSLIDYDFAMPKFKNACIACNAVNCLSEKCNVIKCNPTQFDLFDIGRVVRACVMQKSKNKTCACARCANITCNHDLYSPFYCNNIKCINIMKYYKPCENHNSKHMITCVRCMCYNNKCVRCILSQQIEETNDPIKCYNLNCYYINTD
ncbi:putative F-box protein [Namao virus]|nr:putative F-box protein [Namao virus]